MIPAAIMDGTSYPAAAALDWVATAADEEAEPTAAAVVLRVAEADETALLETLAAAPEPGATVTAVVFGAVALAAPVTGTGATAGALEKAALVELDEAAGAWICPSPIWVTGALLTLEVEAEEEALEELTVGATAVTGLTAGEEATELAELALEEEETTTTEEVETTAEVVALVVVGVPVGAWI